MLEKQFDLFLNCLLINYQEGVSVKGSMHFNWFFLKLYNKTCHTDFKGTRNVVCLRHKNELNIFNSDLLFLLCQLDFIQHIQIAQNIVCGYGMINLRTKILTPDPISERFCVLIVELDSRIKSLQL